MLDQNTDRMWYTIGAIIIGGLMLTGAIFLFNGVAFAGVGEMFDDLVYNTTGNLPKRYVEAEDKDFMWDTVYGTINGYEVSNQSERGYYRYIGKDEFVIIPDTINGDEIIDYYRMFSMDRALDVDKTTQIKGVASNNRNVNSMRNMFNSIGTNTLDVRYLETSGVVNMEGMFESTSRYTNLKLKELKLGDFDTRNVENMRWMFSHSQIKDLDLSSFDTSNVENFYGMFSNSNIETLNIRSFDVSSASISNISGINSMFTFMKNLKLLDIRSFDLTVADYPWSNIRDSEIETVYVAPEFVEWYREGLNDSFLGGGYPDADVVGK